MKTIAEIVRENLVLVCKKRGAYRETAVNDFIFRLVNREDLLDRKYNNSLVQTHEHHQKYMDNFIDARTERVIKLTKEVTELRSKNSQLELELNDVKQDLISKSAQIRHLEDAQVPKTST